jgi:hypothetical protein
MTPPHWSCTSSIALFGVRSWLQRRRTGSTGFHGISGISGTPA